jgi:hypothetical protein
MSVFILNRQNGWSSTMPGTGTFLRAQIFFSRAVAVMAY